jgi:hypothetical protein
MKLTLLLLFVEAAFAGSPARTFQLAPITLFTQFQQTVPTPIVEAIQEELATVMAPSGIHFEWHDLAAASTVGTAVELAVITFRGNCDVAALPPKTLEPVRTLGFTHVSDGEILPFATIDCERTRNFLVHSISRLPVQERQLAFGRALGRILAHELYHIFANTQHHAQGGIAKEAYTVADLLAGSFELDQHEFDLLRASRAYNSLWVAGTK